VITDRPGEFGLVRCTSCGLVFTSPRPTAAALGRYYEDVYSGAGTETMRAMQTGAGARLLAAARFGLLSGLVELGPQTRLLDVGCGYGTFLRHAHDRAGCRVAGCDTDAGSLEAGVAPDGADLRARDLAEAGWPDGSFDVVTLYHSLEHVPDPVSTLRAARRVLCPDGHLVVEVPCFSGLWRRVFGRAWFPLLVPQHLTHFELPTLRRAVEAAGFSRVRWHKGFVSPMVFVASLALALKAVVGPPPEGRRPVWRWLLHRVLALVLLAPLVLVDLPLAVLLARTRWSSHQVLVAQRDETG